MVFSAEAEGGRGSCEHREDAVLLMRPVPLEEVVIPTQKLLGGKEQANIPCAVFINKFNDYSHSISGAVVSNMIDRRVVSLWQARGSHIRSCLLFHPSVEPCFTLRPVLVSTPSGTRI